MAPNSKYYTKYIVKTLHIVLLNTQKKDIEIINCCCSRCLCVCVFVCLYVFNVE